MEDFKLDHTGFSMSKYASSKDLYLAMAKHYQNEYEKSKLVNIDLHLKVLELEEEVEVLQTLVP